MFTKTRLVLMLAPSFDVTSTNSVKAVPALAGSVIVSPLT